MILFITIAYKIKKKPEEVNYMVLDQGVLEPFKPIFNNFV
jgi:hypothetical protein